MFLVPWHQIYFVVLNIAVEPNEYIKDRQPLSTAKIWSILCHVFETVRDRM